MAETFAQTFNRDCVRVSPVSDAAASPSCGQIAGMTLANGAIAITRKPRSSSWSFIAAAFAWSATTVMPASSGRRGCR